MVLSSHVQVVLLCGFTLIKPNIPPWYIGEHCSAHLLMHASGEKPIQHRPPPSAIVACACGNTVQLSKIQIDAHEGREGLMKCGMVV